MSMRPKPIGPVPEDTARVARAAFPKGNALHANERRARQPSTTMRTSRNSSRCADVLPSRRGDWLWLR